MHLGGVPFISEAWCQGQMMENGSTVCVSVCARGTVRLHLCVQLHLLTEGGRRLILVQVEEERGREGRRGERF